MMSTILKFLNRIFHKNRHPVIKIKNKGRKIIVKNVKKATWNGKDMFI